MSIFSDVANIAASLPLEAGFNWVAARITRYFQNETVVRDLAKFVLILAITIAIEIAGRKNWRVRYGSRNFRIDSLYYVFYYGGIYHLLLWGWMYMSLSHLVTMYAPWLQLNLMANMPPTMQVVTLIIVCDFLGYWNHRLRHANRYLWAFHAIHHSQTTLTASTNYRFHIIDETILRLWLFIPFQILGTGITMWLILDFIMAWLLLVQHSEWNWSYGRFGRIFVSPHFHRIHHSRDEHLQNRNFSMLFAFWDDIFNTAERKAPTPVAHGLSGNPVPETLAGQFIYPFIKIAADSRGIVQSRESPVSIPRSGGD